MSKDSDQEALAVQLDLALLQSNLENKHLFKTIQSLLHRSVEFGRASRVLGDSPTDDECQQYVQKVISFHKDNHIIVTCLERREHDTWVRTIEKIRHWSNSYLKNRNIDGPLKINIIEACVPNAALAFLNSVYHYDVNFDAWFCVLVQNVCKKHIKDEMKPSRNIEKTAVSIDKIEFLLEQLADGKDLNAQQQRERRSDLLEAIKKLSSSARIELIMLKYFEGHSFKEISEIMDRSMAAVYKLHHDAINELRDILGDNWH